MPKKKKVKVGEILKKHNALFNYIKDPYGFRVGIVVMMKGETRDTPRIGWALFKETPYRQYGKDIKTLECVPSANNLLNDILFKIREFIFRCEIPDGYKAPEIFDIYDDVKALGKTKISHIEGPGFFNDVLEDRGKADLLSLAIRRANTDRGNYFACLSRNYDRESRENQISVDWDYNEIPINFPDEPYIMHSPILAQTIKKAVKEAEYRAWRYFK